MRPIQVIAVALIAAAVGALIVVKAHRVTPPEAPPASVAAATAAPQPGEVGPTPEDSKPALAQKPKPAGDAKPATASKQLLKVLDLGSEGCIPCEKMKPILAELKTGLKGKVDVEFIDVAKDAAAADKYGIQTIPTQIFFDASGKEVTRHIGFMPKADILAQLRQMGTKGLQ